MAALRKRQTETITVSAATHARLQEIATEQARPMGEIVTDLLRRYEDAQSSTAYRESYEQLRQDPVAWQSYQEEMRLFDRTTGDGLKDEDSYFTSEELRRFVQNSPESPNAGEIWYVDFDPQIGREQAGIRPALVLSNDGFNLAPNGLIVAAPITRTDRGIPAHLRIEAGAGGLTKTSTILCDQAGAIREMRFLRRRRVIPDEILIETRRIVGRFIDAHLIF